MIKFTTTKDDNTGKRMFGIGLSAGNIELLRQGKPIFIMAEEVGIDVDVLVFYGKTELEMKNNLSKYMDSNTKIMDGNKWHS